MRTIFFSFSLLLLLTALCSGCASSARFLSAERAMLTRVAQSPVAKPEQKLDSLFASAIRVMDVALKPVNPVKGGKIVAAYFDQNEASMESIFKNVGGNFDKMNLLEQGSFVVSMLRSPRAREFATLYPRFQKKYKQVKTAGKFIGFFGRSLGKMGKLAELLG
jgi:hypothetical protein